MTRRLALWPIIMIMAVLVLYGWIAYTYSDSSRGSLTADLSPAANQVSVVMELDSPVNDELHTLNLDVFVNAGWDFYEAGSTTLRRGLVIELVTDSFFKTKVFPAGSTIETIPFDIDTDGDTWNYPFDSYRTTILVTAAEVDPSGKRVREVPVVGGIASPRGLIGWQIERVDTDASAEQSPLSQLKTESKLDLWNGLLTGTGDEGLLVKVNISRAHSTILMTALLLTLMVMLAVGSVALARVAWQAHRAVNPAYVSSVAALLFALIPIRQFLPGAPPLGSWIDILVFFWVVIVLMLALISIIYTHVRRAADEE